jgi:stearoyl-CoA desaturase (delta-9 desaturase)
MWGRQRFLTGDTSKNSFWVAMLTFGEGWHNNHHAHPQSAKHGIAWYEFDMNWMGISALRMLGLAWDIKLPKLVTDSPSPAVSKPMAAGEPALHKDLVPATSGD